MGNVKTIGINLSTLTRPARGLTFWKMKLRYEFVHDAMKFWVFDDDRGGLLLSTDKKEDARRIVAAVNAVAGIGTEWLENNAARLHTIVNELAEKRAEVDRLQAQNTKMLEALEMIRDSFDGDTLEGWRSIVEECRDIARTAIAEAETNAPDQHITAAQLQAFSAEIHYIRQISHLQNSIRKLVTASQFAMRLLSQNEGDALAQSCVSQLAQAINAVATFGTGPVIQERPRPEPEMPDYSTND